MYHKIQLPFPAVIPQYVHRTNFRIWNCIYLCTVKYVRNYRIIRHITIYPYNSITHEVKIDWKIKHACFTTDNRSQVVNWRTLVFRHQFEYGVHRVQEWRHVVLRVEQDNICCHARQLFLRSWLNIKWANIIIERLQFDSMQIVYHVLVRVARDNSFGFHESTILYVVVPDPNVPLCKLC